MKLAYFHSTACPFFSMFNRHLIFFKYIKNFNFLRIQDFVENLEIKCQFYTNLYSGIF